MKSASLAEIKKELKNCKADQLADLCLRLAKYSKDNKEFLTYLLFEASDEQGYIVLAKSEIDDLFEDINYTTAYFAKKGLRKTIRIVNRRIKYSEAVETEIELLLYVCEKIAGSAIKKFMAKNEVLNNINTQLIKRIKQAVATLHEDIQYDYHRLIEKL